MRWLRKRLVVHVVMEVMIFVGTGLVACPDEVALGAGVVVIVVVRVDESVRQRPLEGLQYLQLPKLHLLHLVLADDLLL